MSLDKTVQTEFSFLYQKIVIGNGKGAQQLLALDTAPATSAVAGYYFYSEHFNQCLLSQRKHP